MESFQRAIDQRDAAAISVSQALDAANLAAGVADRASKVATDAGREAAAAQLNAAMAELEAARMRAVVRGYAHEMASGPGGGDQVLVALIVSGKPPADVLREVESSERTAATITEALRSLVEMTAVSEAASRQAADAQAKAAAAEAAAQQKARGAATLLAEARTQYRAKQTTLSALLTTDPVVAAAAAYSDVPGCGPADAAGLYPNGMLPSEVLCEPTAAPGHRMRSDAARSFDSLAEAFASQMGEPLCITDSYRSLAAQVALKKVKPTLAAAPGTSNHGWGVAIDMCGGIESFGTPQHNWMRANAALFGWMHPSWAQANGSKPEPWHWEYSPELADQMRGLLGQAKAESKRGKQKQGAAPKNRDRLRVMGRKPRA